MREILDLSSFRPFEILRLWRPCEMFDVEGILELSTVLRSSRTPQTGSALFLNLPKFNEVVRGNGSSRSPRLAAHESQRDLVRRKSLSKKTEISEHKSIKPGVGWELFLQDG